MDKVKIFRPRSTPFIIIMILLNLFTVGLLALMIIGFVEMNWLYIIVGIVGFAFLIFEDAKLLMWKVAFFRDYIYVPSSVFDRFLFGQREIQKIEYAEIEKIELKILPAQILFIQCKGKPKPNAIYVKQFSRKQAEQIMDEINLRTKTVNATD